MCSLVQFFYGLTCDWLSGGFGVVIDDLKETWVSHPEVYGDMLLYLLLAVILFYIFKMFRTRI